MITLEQIHNKIIEAIKLSGLTQKELATKIGISQQAIAQYLHQGKLPALDTFANLCAVLDLDPSDILCISEYEKEKKAVSITNSFNHNKGRINFKA